MDEPVYPSEDAPTHLVNLQHFADDDIDVYIGGENEMYDFDESIHHNPYSVSEYGRREAIAHYRTYFYKKYLEDEEYRAEVHDLWGKTLAEWNYPEHCHGEVIIDLLQEWNEGGHERVLSHIEHELESIDPSHLGVEGLKNKDEVTNLLREQID